MPDAIQRLNVSQFMRLDDGRETLKSLKSEVGKFERTGELSKENIDAKKAKAKKAAQDFEAIFIRQFMKTMRSTLSNGGMFGEGSTGEIYGDMMDNALAEKMSERSILGVSGRLYSQLVKDIDRQVEQQEKMSQE